MRMKSPLASWEACVGVVKEAFAEAEEKSWSSCVEEAMIEVVRIQENSLGSVWCWVITVDGWLCKILPRWYSSSGRWKY